MKKLYMIGNSHIDPVWLWRWQEGYAEVLATYRSALDRMREFPKMKFTTGCAVYHEWVEKTDPEMFREIQERVKEGRWNIVGGWYLQPDCNIPDGESFARSTLISQRYFKEKFGITATTGYNVDSFGHNANLPKILRGGGMTNYVFMRPSPQEQGRDESLFMWQSDDDSMVCAYRIPIRYCIDQAEPYLSEIRTLAENQNIDLMAFYGVGNHGGGPTIKLIRELDEADKGDLVYSTPDEYFKNAEKSKLPIMRDELQHHARGCYSAHSMVKMVHRKSEQNLLVAEKFCVMAKELLGEEYPAEKLKEGWKNLLFNQFHDILCGCSVKNAYEDAGYLFGETMSITERAINNAMQKIAWNIDTLNGEVLPSHKTGRLWEHEVLGTPLVVFNSHTWPVKECVAVSPGAKKVTDFQGNEVPFDLVRGEYICCETDKLATAFIAEVPALGYAVYRIFYEQEAMEKPQNELQITEHSMENSKIKVEFDLQTGDINYMYNKESDEVIIDKSCRAIILDESECDTWAHDKVKLGDFKAAFHSPKFRILENGIVRVTLRVITECEGSVLQRDYTLCAGSDSVRVRTKVNFTGKNLTLKFCFPMADEKVIAKIPYGTIIRNGYTGEEPCGSWIACKKLCIANDSKYGYDTENGEMRLTILRSVNYAAHCCVRDEFCEYMEQGEHEFTYIFTPFKGNSDAEHKAAELNAGLRYILGGFHKGTLPEKMSCFSAENDDIIVSAVKQSEDGNKNILRAYDIAGKNTETKLRIFGKEVNANFGHNQVKTFDFDGNEYNFIEW